VIPEPEDWLGYNHVAMAVLCHRGAWLLDSMPNSMRDTGSQRTGSATTM